MELIDKDVLLTEIENRIDRCNTKKWSCPANTQVEAICDNKIGVYKEILSFLDILEVKVVDLCKEEERIWKDFNIAECPLSKKDLEKISRHFFELGLKAQKGE